MTGVGPDCPPYVVAGCGPADTVAAANAGSDGAPGVPVCRGGAGRDGGGAGNDGSPGPDEGPIPGPLEGSTLFQVAIVNICQEMKATSRTL
jgi:hypothetical protein